MKICPFCEKDVHDDVVVCPHCGRDQWTAHISLATAAGVPKEKCDEIAASKAGFLRSRKVALVLVVLIVLLALGLCGYQLHS